VINPRDSEKGLEVKYLQEVSLRYLNLTARAEHLDIDFLTLVALGPPSILPDACEGNGVRSDCAPRRCYPFNQSYGPADLISNHIGARQGLWSALQGASCGSFRWHSALGDGWWCKPLVLCQWKMSGDRGGSVHVARR